jgi:hypothetical protein
MKTITKNLKKELQTLGKNYVEKVNRLFNKYQGEDCYILTCGPSINDFDRSSLQNFLQDKLVLSVKSTYSLFDNPNIIDFHFYNCCNLPPVNETGEHYRYDDTVSVSSSNFPYGLRWSPFQTTDIFFRVPTVNPNTNMESFLAVNKNFDQYILKNQFDRPVGPGIMYETVIFLAVHMGVKNIISLGWDLSSNNVSTVDQYSHFYHDETKMFNPGTMMTWEIEATTAASKDLYLWLKNQDINWVIGSSNSALYDQIPRVKIL